MSVATVLFFKNIDGFGWSERYWYNGSAVDPTVAADLATLTSARANLSTTNVLITHARMDSGVLRNPRIFPLNAGAGIPGNQPTPTGPSEVAILFRTNAGISGFNRIFIRGIPERVFSADSFTPDAAYTIVLNSYISTLKNGKWSAVGTLGGSPAQHPMSALTTTPPRGWFATVGISGLLPGDMIRVHNQKIVGYTGLKQIVDIRDAGLTFVMGGAAPAANGIAGATYYTVPGSFDALITDAFAEGLSRRGAGRPFGLSRGRRQTTVPLRQ